MKNNYEHNVRFVKIVFIDRSGVYYMYEGQRYECDLRERANVSLLFL